MIFAVALAGAMQIAWNDLPQQSWSAHVNAAHTEMELTTVFRVKTARGNWDDEEGHSIALSEVAARFPGLSAEQLLSDNARIHFQSIHDAGTLDYTGTATQGNAAGTFSIIANPQFAGTLQRRGIGMPTADQQRELVLMGADYSYLDLLAKEGLDRRGVAQLLRLLEHGVSPDYLRALAALHVTPHSTEDLLRLRDHGVDAEFIKQFEALGYTATATELVRLRDHGVTAGYVTGLRRRGYTAHLSVDELIRLRDHGI